MGEQGEPLWKMPLELVEEEVEVVVEVKENLAEKMMGGTGRPQAPPELAQQPHDKMRGSPAK